MGTQEQSKRGNGKKAIEHDSIQTRCMSTRYNVDKSLKLTDLYGGAVEALGAVASEVKAISNSW